MGLHGAKIAHFIAHPDERDVERLVGKRFCQQVSVEPVGFADETFNPVSIYGMFEMSFRDRNEDLDG